MLGNIYEDSAVIIRKTFDLPSKSHEFSREGLIVLLEPEIQRLLDRDFEKLLQICYRVDLEEEKLNYILEKSPPDCLCNDLTQALVDRLLLKAKLKSHYKNKT